MIQAIYLDRKDRGSVQNVTRLESLVRMTGAPFLDSSIPNYPLVLF